MEEMSYDEWLAAWENRDDRRYLRRLGATTGPKRKVPVLCDQNLEDEFVSALRQEKWLRVHRLPDHRGDDVL